MAPSPCPGVDSTPGGGFRYPVSSGRRRVFLLRSRYPEEREAANSCLTTAHARLVTENGLRGLACSTRQCLLWDQIPTRAIFAPFPSRSTTPRILQLQKDHEERLHFVDNDERVAKQLDPTIQESRICCPSCGKQWRDP